MQNWHTRKTEKALRGLAYWNEGTKVKSKSNNDARLFSLFRVCFTIYRNKCKAYMYCDFARPNTLKKQKIREFKMSILREYMFSSFFPECGRNAVTDRTRSGSPSRFGGGSWPRINRPEDGDEVVAGRGTWPWMASLGRWGGGVLERIGRVLVGAMGSWALGSKILLFWYFFDYTVTVAMRGVEGSWNGYFVFSLLLLFSLLQVRPVHRQVAAHLRGVARHRPARPHGGALSRPGSVRQSLGNIINVYQFPPKKVSESCWRGLIFLSSQAVRLGDGSLVRTPFVFLDLLKKIHKNDYVCA